MDETKILEILTRIESGQADIKQTISELSQRLNRTRKGLNRRIGKLQLEHDDLKKVVQAMQSAPKLRNNPTCLDRDGVYKLIETLGYDRTAALEALLDGGYIQAGEHGRRTVNQRINGEVKRVIVINMGGD